jgi:hypothetical protein
MRNAILALALVAIAASPAHAERFAISCSGKDVSEFRNAQGQAMTSRALDIRDIVYVIDEERQTVERFVAAQGKLDDVCGLPGLTCNRSFSAARVTLSGETTQGYRTVIGFDWDRQANRVETTFDMFGANGAGMVSRWSLKCEPAAIPGIQEVKP